MKGRGIPMFVLVILSLLCDRSTNAHAQADATWLITEEEASQPAQPSIRGEPTLPKDGPIIRVVSPDAHAPVKAPFAVDVSFEPRPEGAPVKMESLRVTYLKLLEIDLTERLRPYVNGTRLFAPDTKVPQDRHRLRITIADERGNLTAEILTVTVQ